ncbi:MAG: hypothetical protein MRJ52_04420 [Nitrosomonas sp.]|nr:hypothetical protein [Nitrosomonas sp.]
MKTRKNRAVTQILKWIESLIRTIRQAETAEKADLQPKQTQKEFLA